jgi:hypothetical protein
MFIIKFFICFLLFFITITSYSQETNSKNKLYLVVKDNKVGYINDKAELVIPCVYKNGGGFENNIAAVQNNKWGCIDKKGKLIVPFLYDSVKYLREGYLGIKLYNKWGIIDSTGNLIIPCIYEFLDKTSVNGYFQVALKDTMATKFGIVDHTGKLISSITYDLVKANYIETSNGKFTVKFNGYWGLIDTTGKIVIPFIYNSIEKNRDGSYKISKNNKFGMMDENAKIIIQCKYDEVGLFDKNGLADVILNSKVAYVNNKGELVSQFIYDSWNEKIDYNKTDYFNSSVKKNMTISLNYTTKNIKKQYTIVFENGKVGFINNFGKIITTPIFDLDVYTYLHAKYSGELLPPDWGEGYFAVKIGNKWGFVDSTGSYKIPCKYENNEKDSYYGIDIEIPHFSEGLAKVKLNNKWGYIDKNGKFIVNNQYDYCLDFQDGVAGVKKNFKWALIDRNGKLITDFIFDFLFGHFKEDGLAYASTDSKSGFIDKSGQFVLTTEHLGRIGMYELANLKFNKSGVAALKNYDNGKWGFMNKSGELIAPFIYQSFVMFGSYHNTW